MVNIGRLENNIYEYINEELVTRMPALSGALFATAAPFVVRAKIRQYFPLFKDTEIVDGESVDVEALYHEFKRSMSGKFPVEMAGFTFRESDLDELYRYIVR